MAILVTGGAGYVGSHMGYALIDRGEEVVILDDLSAGSRMLVSPGAIFIQGDVADGWLVRETIRKHRIDMVMHFAGSIVVPDSVEQPLIYYRNNTIAARELIAACVDCGVKHFVFSSSAAVYGNPEHLPVAECAPKSPINPYGRSKLMTEWILEDAARAHEFEYATLRYFNVAGADPLGRTGQVSRAATHLIKRACQAALGRLTKLEIYGSNFETPDGTGIRDYIHVVDLVSAHLRAVDHLRGGGRSIACNAGYGRGFSVLEVIRAVEGIANQRLVIEYAPQRPGDPPVLIADPALLKSTFGWQPTHDDLVGIVRSAFEWERKLAS